MRTMRQGSRLTHCLCSVGCAVGLFAEGSQAMAQSPETRPREVVSLRYQGMPNCPTAHDSNVSISQVAPAATATFSYSLRATMPVKASDGGGQAYLYYEPDRRVYATSQALEVTAQ